MFFVFGRFTTKPKDPKIIEAFEKLKIGMEAVFKKEEASVEMFKCKSFAEGDISKTGEFDLVVIGPSKEWILKTFLFGSNVDMIAKKAKCPVLLVKQPSTKIETWTEFVSKKVLGVFKR